MLKRVVVTGLLAIGVCLGQTTSSASMTIPTSTVSGSLLTSSTSESGIRWMVCNHDLCTSVAGGGWMNGGAGIPPEIRKLDHKGPSLSDVKLAAHRMENKDLAPPQYITLAKSLGVGLSAEESILIQAIANAGLEVYDYKKVDGYLYRKALEQGTNIRWVWKPIRDKDVEIVKASTAAWGDSGMGFVFPKQYAREIPMHVLAEMEAILGDMPNALFIISDYEVVKPDPFIAVTSPKLLEAGKLWVIDQYDEPGFGTEEPATVAKR